MVMVGVPFIVALEWFRTALPAVFLPLAFSLVWLRRHAQTIDQPLGAIVLLSALLTAYSGQWSITEELVSLHLIPVFFIWVACMNYAGWMLPPGLAFALAFFTLISADVTLALRMHPDSAWDALRGVGGAGLRDGLVFFPLATVTVQAYAQMRRREPLQMYNQRPL